MAAISGRLDVPPEHKKHPDITAYSSLGRSRGGFGTKIYLATDGSGLPLNIVLSPGQAHESHFVQRLLDSSWCSALKCQYLILSYFRIHYFDGGGCRVRFYAIFKMLDKFSVMAKRN